ncbi:hypothetical protein ACNPK3_21335, partial [Shewanella algae]
MTKLLAMVLGFSVHFAMAETPAANIQSITDEVDQQAGMLMEKYHIPGMAIAISIGGEQHFYHYGMADVNAGIKVSRHGVVDQIIRLNATAPRLSAALRDFLA